MRKKKNDRSGISRILAGVFFLGFCLVAVQRVEAKSSEDGLCERDHAKRGINYEIEYALAPPPGLTPDQAKRYSDGAEVLRRFVRDQVFLILAEYQVKDGSLVKRDFPYQAQASIRDYINLDKEDEYRFPNLELYAREISDGVIKILACTAENCRKLGQKEAEKLIYIKNGYAGEIGKARAFIGDVGVDLGRFLSDSYLLVPSIQRGSLCRQAGLLGECLDKNLGNQLCSGSQRYDLSNRTSNTVSIQKEKPIFCGAIDANSYLGERWRTAGGELESKRESESWVSFQLLFALGIKVSPSSSVSITKDRVSWDPSLLCRFSRPRQELRTQ